MNTPEMVTRYQVFDLGEILPPTHSHRDTPRAIGLCSTLEEAQEKGARHIQWIEDRRGLTPNVFILRHETVVTKTPV